MLPLLSLEQPRTDAVRLDGTAIVETAIAPILRFAPDPGKPGQEVPRRAGFHTMELTDSQMEIEQLKEEALAQGVPSERL